MPHPQWEGTSEEGRGRKLFALVTMLLGAIHTGLKQNVKGQFCLLFWAPCLHLPVWPSIYKGRGKRPLEKPIPSRLFPAVKWSQGWTFCWIHTKEGVFFIGLAPKHELFLVKFPANTFPGSLNPREHFICNKILNGDRSPRLFVSPFRESEQPH